MYLNVYDALLIDDVLHMCLSLNVLFALPTNLQGQPTIMPLELPEPLGPKLFIWGEPVLSWLLRAFL